MSFSEDETKIILLFLLKRGKKNRFIFHIFLFTFNVFAKSLDQKKDELKKIYEVRITKAEYEKAVEFLEKPKEKKTEKNLYH